MRIPIDTIPDDGVHVTIEGSEPWAVDVAASVLEVPARSVGAELHVTRMGGTRALQVQGTARARGTRLCERCGEPVDLRLESRVSLSYVPVEDAPDVAELRLDPDDLDVGWYRDGVLDLSDVLSEALALELPQRITCEDTAACDARVAELLEGSSPQEPDDNPFAALRDLV